MNVRRAVDYELIKYKGNKYYVCEYMANGVPKLFVIDKEDLPIILFNNARINYTNGYVTRKKNGKMDYLHRLILNIPEEDDEGNKLYVDHYNRNTHDNRRANLRAATQSEQNENQKQRERKGKLPDDVHPDDVPKCVTYQKKGASGRFVLELKKDGERHIFHSTSSKKISNRDKLVQITWYVLLIAEQYGDLINSKNIVESHFDNQIDLMKEFNKIIKLSNFPSKHGNLMTIPEKKVLRLNLEGVNEDIINYMSNIGDVLDKKGRNIDSCSKLPPNCGVEDKDIPKYCRFTAAKENRNDFFTIERHPNILEKLGKDTWKTNARKDVSILSKFKELMKMYNYLEYDAPIDKDFLNKAKKKQVKKITKKQPQNGKEGESEDDNAIEPDTLKTKNKSSKKRLSKG